MRITNSMMISNMLNILGKNEERLSKYQNQLDTGKKISRPSDDPVVAARALKLRTDLSKVEQFQKNIDDAQSWVDATDSALAEIGDILKRAKEISVEAANGTNTEDETRDIGQEMKQLRVQLVHLANTTYAGRYLFSGFKTDQKLVNDDEQSPDFGKFSISVDSNVERIAYDIGVGDTLNINIPGGQLFNYGGDATNPANGVSTSQINNITYPYTIDGTNNIVGVTVEGANITGNIAAGTYNDAVSLSSAVAQAVNNGISTYNATLLPTDPQIQPIQVTINNGSLELRTTSRTATSTISITAPPQTSFFSSVGATNEVTTTGATGEPSLIKLFNDVIGNMDSGDYKAVSDQLDSFDLQMDSLLGIRADIGARQNRIDLTRDRMSSDNVNFTDLMSKNEDVNPAETIMNLKNEENVYQASLAGGARIIQQTLVDFLR